MVPYVIEDLAGKETVATFYEKELRKSNRVKNWRSNKKKGDELYVKWKDYDNSINSWIDNKDNQVVLPTKKKIKGELLCNKIWSEKGTGVGTSYFPKKCISVF